MPVQESEAKSGSSSPYCDRTSQELILVRVGAAILVLSTIAVLVAFVCSKWRLRRRGHVRVPNEESQRETELLELEPVLDAS